MKDLVLILLGLVGTCHGSPLSPSTSFHSYMSDKELHFYFGDEKPSDYEVITVEVIHPASKRSGIETNQPSLLNFNALGQDYSLQLHKNRDLLAPFAVVGKRGAGKANDERVPIIDVTNIEEPLWLDWDDIDFGNMTGHMEDHNDRDMSMDELVVDRKVEDEADCHYLHNGDNIVASVSLCDGQTHGLVIGQNHSLEILPLNHRLKRMLDMWQDENKTINNGVRTREPRNFHLVKRTTKHETRPYLDVVKEMFSDQDNSMDEFEMDKTVVPQMVNQTNITTEEGDTIQQVKRDPSYAKRSGSEKVIETALFLDSAAYYRFSHYFKSIGIADYDKEIRRFVLGYMNGIQALYMLPSLVQTIKFTIVRLELWERDQINTYQGDRAPLLDSFCDFQHKANSQDDGNPGHWDLALFVSGLNFYALDPNGQSNMVTMGLARVGGVCQSPHACVIGELGVTTNTGKPYPSAGFTAVYVMAHEIGHYLGMSHDGAAGCDRDGFIMSESRGTNGENRWSQCSVNSLHKYEGEGRLSCLNDNNGKKEEVLGMESNQYPGETWTATAQCQIFLLDNNAHIDHTASDFQDMCYSIKCRTSKREGYYKAGPALEGTACGEGKWCRHGECVVNDKPKEDEYIAPGQWSDWAYSGCQSGCTSNSYGASLGAKIKQRSCQRGRLVHTLEGCKGPTTGIEFCDDGSICSSRVDTTKYASEQCSIFSSYVPDIDKAGLGTQIKYSDKWTWHSCAIFCKKTNGGWYTPRLELNDLPQLSAYFPDGTPCHQEGDKLFYCQKNECLERDSRGGKSDTPDLQIFSNAAPEGDGERDAPQELKKYFSLDADLNPVSGGEYAGLQGHEDDDAAWDVIDYVN